jgi:hypothetical protein
MQPEAAAAAGERLLELAARPQQVLRLRAHQFWLPGIARHASTRRLEDQHRQLPRSAAAVGEGASVAHRCAPPGPARGQLRRPVLHIKREVVEQAAQR